MSQYTIAYNEPRLGEGYFALKNGDLVTASTHYDHLLTEFHFKLVYFKSSIDNQFASGRAIYEFGVSDDRAHCESVAVHPLTDEESKAIELDRR